MNQRYARGILAVTAGMAVNFFGDWLLGARIEIFSGIATFTFPWMLDVFLVPFIAGLVVAKVFGSKGGKWLACLPPLFVRCISYAYMYFFVFNDGKDFAYHLNLFYWGPCVILVVEAANFGGILGEVLIGAYRRKNRLAAEPGNAECAKA
ncbi:MAG: hypothetical protein GC139_03790 [Sideroxydans sp.]|nr:hypothetical protein [Sideroxydans sp.]